MMDTRRRRAIGRATLVLAVVGCIAWTLVVILTSIKGGYAFEDWQTYAAAVDRLLRGQPIYAPAQLVGPYWMDSVLRVGYVYPPSTVVLFVPFASGAVGLVSWLALNVALLFGGLAAVIRRELGSVRPMAMAMAVAGLAVYWPFLRGVAMGNASVGLAGLLALSWAAGRDARVVGWYAAAGAALKIVPGTLVGWARPGSVRAVGTVVAVTAALGLLTLPLVGLGSWFDFGRALSNSVPICPMDGRLYSVACLLEPTMGIQAAKAAGIVLAAVLVLAAWRTRNDLVALVLVAGAWLAPVADLQVHYLLVPYVVAVIVLARWQGRRTSRQGLGDAGVSGLALDGRASSPISGPGLQPAGVAGLPPGCGQQASGVRLPAAEPRRR